ncbi:hypothetical protein LEP1GSC035_0092 [Leptospira noguchii str. 2007001578]|uniref:Transposase, IS116/IS110/IS902 domain protein n=1 Tax=Leptospira noguchii str. 2007001578 TaxID=1049974 RepID=A0ABN0J1V8_9LEPT|nr:hypothetical protein LEP1GSC035_0092 [Leptospira noguchii str. 2007001578]
MSHFNYEICERFAPIFLRRTHVKKGAKKSIIAASRKMIEVLYSMIRTGTLFDSMPEEVLNRKLAQYGLM